jgi:hypothetical protein
VADSLPSVAQAQPDTPDPESLADAAERKAIRDNVQRTFALGYHITELYHFDRVGSAPSAPHAAPPAPPLAGAAGQALAVQQAAKTMLADSLPGMSRLEPGRRRSILIRQVREDLKQPGVWADTPGGVKAAQLDRRVAAADKIPDHDLFKAEIASIHEVLLEGLTVADYRLGKSYGLGRALAETSIIPCAIGTKRGLPAGATHGEIGNALKGALEDQFEGGRVFELQSWLLDLRDWFADYASDAVATTLGGWALWVIRPTIGADPLRWDHPIAYQRVQRSLRRQGDVWRGLLSGEKDPKSIAGADYYFAAMASVVRRLASLALRFLGTWIGFLLFLIVVVAGLALYFASTTQNATGVLAAVAALLSALGITTGSVGASVKSAWSKAEEPLWAAEVAAAVANAAWHNPAPLGSIEMIELLLIVGDKPDQMTETRARHPNLTALRNIRVGRLGLALMVISIAVALFAADAGHLNRDASFFLPPLCVVAFLAIIDGWDLLVGLAVSQSAPYLALPERIAMPDWLGPVAFWLAPIFVLTGLLAGHFFWH